MIHGHGDDIYCYGRKILHNFSTNVYGGFDHSSLKSHLISKLDTISSYPEPEPVTVERTLSLAKNIRSENVMVTNGATESIYMIAQAYSGRKSAIISPTFSEYADACRMHGHTLSFPHSISSIAKESEIVWLCNPNNPTGKVTEKESLLETIDTSRNTLFVIDQAYADYTLHPVLAEKEAIERNNVILLGSLTKRFAIPGLRIGYAIASEPLLQFIRQFRMPWTVNQLAIEAANYLIENSARYKIDANMLNSEASRIARAFNELGLTTYSTDCNILLCRLHKGSARQLKQYLIENHGILIRDASNFYALDSSYFRIAPLSRDENNLLIKSVKKWIQLL